MIPETFHRRQTHALDTTTVERHYEPTQAAHYLVWSRLGWDSQMICFLNFMNLAIGPYEWFLDGDYCYGVRHYPRVPSKIMSPRPDSNIDPEESA
ncbi:hypothetical protein DAPPUDRAFT_336912 [Daphnia pulex]|uniref:Uncharacterized protein n=1 Tax=Daphnia pulex TaxID=6669 RepID=E9I0L5_DAPPU|nr:hypothetical protein DAPPUDRAFT_336912 [Daphnia pulex]|eukprot:EFX62465.1 hypothetical protein DAPPUDRAFT_336912 [Daphnia pulex]